MPMSEPTTDPRATGPATAMTISPRMKYAPAALAAAVTPIMKLEVAEGDLDGEACNAEPTRGDFQHAAADPQQGRDQARAVHQQHSQR